MKKLLVLALVLGVAGLAGAGSMTANQLTANTGSVSGSGYIIDGGVPQFTGFYGVVVGTLPTYVVNYAGSQVTIADIDNSEGALDALAEALSINVGDIAKAWAFDFADTTPPPSTILPNGLLTTFTGAGVATLYLLDAVDASALSGSPLTFVPEPITLALLGLGGLFIRRKK